MKPDSYHLLSARRKRERSTAAQREPSVVCPRCQTSTMPADLLGHLLERCPGELPEAHPASRWLARDEALRCGARASVIERWTKADLLRTRGDGEVLERDLVQLIAWARVLEAL